MRILVLNQYFHPDRAATALLLTELCEDMARHHEVQVVSGRPSYNPDQDATPPPGGVDVRRAWSTSFDRRWMPGRLANYASYLLGSALRAAAAQRPDVILAWTDPPMIGAIAAQVARLRRAPLVLGLQDVYPEVAIKLGRVDNPAAVAVLRVGSNAALRGAVAVVALGRDMSRRLTDRGVPEERIHVIPNWADGRVVKPLCKPSALRRELGLEDSFVVMHSGNIGFSQNLDRLLDAAELLGEHPDVRIVIAGEGAGRDRLAAEIARRRLENVKLIGYQPRAGLSESLGMADLHVVSLLPDLAGCVVPSKVYGIMAAGRPFLAALEPWAEPALIAEEERCGFRVDPGDAGALAAAIVELRKAPLAEMGARARNAFERKYDRPVATKRYRQLLESAAQLHLPAQKS